MKRAGKKPEAPPAPPAAGLTILNSKPRAKKKQVSRKPRSREQVFVDEYMVDMVGSKAAIRAGYSPDTARVIACQLLAKPAVKEAIAKAQEARAAKTGITADRVLERMWAVATADPNELIEQRRVCCRYCYGKKHRYQRTPRELAEAIAQFDRDKMSAEAKGQQFPAVFDAQGGIGYDPRKDPRSECPECFGEGEERTFPKDTRDLSPAGKLLYAGVKKTDKGLEIKMHSQSDALLNVGKHLGLFKERVEFTDPDGIVDRMLAARARAAPREQDS